MLKDEVADKLAEFIGPIGDDGPKRFLEIGTGWGESTTFLSELKPQWKLYTIDGFGLYGDGRIYDRIDHEKVAILNACIMRLGNVIQILGDSSRIPWELPIEGFLIDGDHREPGVRADFLNFAEWVIPGGIVIFDDYTQENYGLNGVKTVVDEILRDNGVNEMSLYKWEPVYIGHYCAILQKQFIKYDKFDI